MFKFRTAPVSTLLKLLCLSSGFLGTSLPLVAQQQETSSLKQLASDHRWSELREAAARTHATFYQAMGAAVFNEPQAEKLFRLVIAESPASEEAYDAYDWLSNIYMKSGRYHSLETVLKARWAAFPNKSGVATERADLAPFRGLPDQENGPRKASVLAHEHDSLSVAVSVNGKPASFLFDDGADISSISEDEAKALGMTIHAASGSIHSMTKDAAFRMAVAKDVVIGKMHFHNVSFAVFPDAQEPWSLVPKDQRGIIGLPLMVGTGSFEWSADGTITIAGKSQPLKPSNANLFFDGGKRPVVAAQFQGTDLWLALDTGATTTDVYASFAERFPQYLAEHGTAAKNEIRGIGGAETYEAVNLPELPLTIGGQQVMLRSVSVMTGHSNWRKWIAANLGKDLLLQTGGFRVDFGAMTLSLENRKPDRSKP
jgi:hypothetical protein